MSRLRGIAIVAAALLAVLAGGVAWSAGRAVVIRDGSDVDGRLDMRRVAFGRGPDGRLRATFTMSDDWDARDLSSSSGPPGSICLRIWTTRPPGQNRPDYLACITAKADRKTLQASVLKERDNELPTKSGPAEVGRPSSRTVVLRFAQSAVGKPATLQFAAETTRAGCPRVSCVDTAPDAPKTVTLVLRRKTATGKP